LETNQPAPLIKDAQAQRIIEEIDLDFSHYGADTITHLATILRTREFDRLVISFLRQHPHGTVVNLGCGMDTRYYRLGVKTAYWYDLDLPEVIALRRQFIKEATHCYFISCSAQDFSWMQQIEDRPQQAILFVAEGLLMYWHEQEVKRLILALKNHFPGARLIFDAVSPWQAYWSRFHPTITQTGACFRWGLGSSKEIENWETGICLKHQIFYFDQPSPRLGYFGFLKLFPLISRGFCIYEYELT
jgi:O-methyltransferase involved in polyketide biosynthesis